MQQIDAIGRRSLLDLETDEHEIDKAVRMILMRLFVCLFAVCFVAPVVL